MNGPNPQEVAAAIIDGKRVSIDFDRDPAALAWARGKVERHIDKLRRWEQQAAAEGNTASAEQWRRLHWYLHRSFVGGSGCVIAGFDERKPDLPAQGQVW